MSLNKLIPIQNWHPKISGNHLFIAGPCSAESEEQMLQTAKEIVKIPSVNIFRAGIWKPRTRPGYFEGVGDIGLHWLKEVKAQTGLLTATEVAFPEHVEKCLKEEIDILWIGARTTANPFSVQEIASALKGTDTMVLVKNPVNPDLDLWIGGIERLHKAGIQKLAAIHRGFFPFERTKLRNIPKWELVIELKRRFPELPIICDPSHIAGKPDFIPAVAQKALDLNMDGLMIETHIEPARAKSDSAQQVTPSWLKELLQNLKIRTENPSDKKLINWLEQFREQIDSIDAQLLELLAQRMDIIKQIGAYKCEHNISVFQLRRWEKIIKSRTNQGEQLGLDEDFIIKLLQLIHKVSIQKQSEIMDGDEKCKGKKGS